MVKISLFGNPGTGTSSVGKLFSQRNNLEFVSSGDMFRQLAESLGYELYEFSKLCQENPEYDKQLDIKINKFGQENDNFIIDSRLAWHFIPDSVKIKLICNFDTRIKRISGRDGVSIDFAREKTIFRENSEKLRYKNYYGIDDFTDDNYFDLIINTTNLPIKKVCEKIENFIFRKK